MLIFPVVEGISTYDVHMTIELKHCVPSINNANNWVQFNIFPFETEANPSPWFNEDGPGKIQRVP